MFFKLVIFASLCVAVVLAQDDATTAVPKSSVNRMARGAPDVPSTSDMVNKGAETGNLGMEGIMENIPDSTAIIKKAQDMVGQPASGRRRRHLLIQVPALPIV